MDIFYTHVLPLGALVVSGLYYVHRVSLYHDRVKRTMHHRRCVLSSRRAPSLLAPATFLFLRSGAHGFGMQDNRARYISIIYVLVICSTSLSYILPHPDELFFANQYLFACKAARAVCCCFVCVRFFWHGGSHYIEAPVISFTSGPA